MSGEKWQPWADFSQFRKERLVRAKFEEQWTRFECIYAHYRRWSFLRDEKPRSAEHVEAELTKAAKGQVEDFRGHKLFPCWVNVPEKAMEEPETESRKVVEEIAYRGRVRTLRPLPFRDVTVLGGAELDWMEPNARERSEMREVRQREDRGHEPLPLIVLVAGIRRFVKQADVEKL